MMSGWVKYEWTTFANEIGTGRKNGNIISNNTVIHDVTLDTMTMEAYNSHIK